MGIGNSISLKTMKDRATERAKRLARIWLCDSQGEYEMGDALVEFAKKEVRLAGSLPTDRKIDPLIYEIAEKVAVEMRDAEQRIMQGVVETVELTRKKKPQT